MSQLFSIFGPTIVVYVVLYVFHGLCRWATSRRFTSAALSDEMKYKTLHMESPERRYLSNIRTWING